MPSSCVGPRPALLRRCGSGAPGRTQAPISHAYLDYYVEVGQSCVACQGDSPLGMSSLSTSAGRGSDCSNASQDRWTPVRQSGVARGPLAYIAGATLVEQASKAYLSLRGQLRQPMTPSPRVVLTPGWADEGAVGPLHRPTCRTATRHRGQEAVRRSGRRGGSTCSPLGSWPGSQGCHRRHRATRSRVPQGTCTAR
jgi:hypothetical protein